MFYFSEHTKEVKNWGLLKVVRVLPNKDGDPWGVFSPLKSTEWATLFSTISGEALSNALYGYINEFLVQVGDLPSLKLARLGKHWMCKDYHNNQCGMRLLTCYPGSGIVPMCYKYPQDATLIGPVSQLLDYVKSDYYVVIVEGPGFTVNKSKQN